MKKILLTLLCLFIISISASSAFAASDADHVVTEDSLQPFDMDDIFISVYGDYFNCTDLVLGPMMPDYGFFNSVPVSQDLGFDGFNLTVEPDDNPVIPVQNEPTTSQSTQDNKTLI